MDFQLFQNTVSRLTDETEWQFHHVERNHAGRITSHEFRAVSDNVKIEYNSLSGIWVVQLHFGAAASPSLEKAYQVARRQARSNWNELHPRAVG